MYFWVDVTYEHIKSDHPNIAKCQLVAQILREYERRGDALRCLNNHGKIACCAKPRAIPRQRNRCITGSRRRGRERGAEVVYFGGPGVIANVVRGLHERLAARHIDCVGRTAPG